MNLTAFTLNPSQPEGYGARAASTLLTLKGVKDVLVNAPDQICSVLYDDRQVSPIELLAALDEAGFASEVLLPPGAGKESCCGGCS